MKITSHLPNILSQTIIKNVHKYNVKHLKKLIICLKLCSKRNDGQIYMKRFIKYNSMSKEFYWKKLTSKIMIDSIKRPDKAK